MRLIRYLCRLFRCPPSALRWHLKDPRNAEYLRRHLANDWTVLETNHLRINCVVRYEGMSEKSVREEYAYNGANDGCTVAQHMFSRHRIKLRHKDLPAVVERGGGEHRTYWPIECLDIHFLPKISYLTL